MIDITLQKVAIGKIRIKLYRANILKNIILTVEGLLRNNENFE